MKHKRNRVICDDQLDSAYVKNETKGRPRRAVAAEFNEATSNARHLAAQLGPTWVGHVWFWFNGFWRYDAQSGCGRASVAPISNKYVAQLRPNGTKWPVCTLSASASTTHMALAAVQRMAFQEISDATSMVYPPIEYIPARS